MSEPQSPMPQSPEPFEPEVGKAAGPAFRRRWVRLPKRRGSRWALGAAAVLVLGVALTAGVALHHPERGRPMAEWGFGHRVPGAPEAPGAPGAPGAYGWPGAHQDGRMDGWMGDREGNGKGDGKAAHRGAQGSGAEQPGGRAAKLAPAPLPAVAADQALAKAAGAVPGGKVGALSVVGREGGGSSWAVEVLGTDGVRHLVMVDGTDGSITGNTVVNGR
ncbi:hypothetical protein [Kitasatospora sp. NPDC059673]|uniref:hypothetical protein n=1 Tax=Kitasatospora sp. NPDC059673 TaxID=3346901 RepID=UPI0036C735D3